MKKVFLLFAVVATLIACGDGESKTETTEQPKEEVAKPASPSDNPDYAAGLAIEVKQNCNTCHKVDEKLIGPAYKEIAAKYSGADTAVAYLSKKVIAGGSGVWGTVPMLAHPELSQGDAEAIVKYVLLLK